MAVLYLNEQKRTVDKGLSVEWVQIEELYNEKLWNELTLKLKTFIKHPALQDEKAMNDIYYRFISTFETKINPFGLVEILSTIIEVHSDKQEAVKFMDMLEEKVKNCDEAVWYVKVLKGQIYLEHLNDIDSTKKIIEDLKDLLEEADITLVHGKYYMLAAQYYRVVGMHAEYYKCGLLFLGCSNEALSVNHRSQHAFFLCLAALLGDGVYNLGELLAHPILKSLDKSENEWLISLLAAFNSGDIKKFESMKPLWYQIADLAAHEVKLRQKISLLCLMEMTFKRPINKKSISFEEISEQTGLPLKDTELLIMKGLAQGLVRGTIDQVKGVVNMTWVKPRVLNCQQINNMVDSIEVWINAISNMEQLIESTAHEIILN
jgi:26S proteasome regulatory subunit N9